MRLWYSQRLQKAVLATFAGTFTFAFGNLRRVNDTFVPDVGVTVAGFACGGSLVMLLVYLDSFTHHLRPVAVASLVAAARTASGRRRASRADADPDTRLPPSPPATRSSRSLPAGRSHPGRPHAGLLALAERHDCTLVLTLQRRRLRLRRT